MAGKKANNARRKAGKKKSKISQKDIARFEALLRQRYANASEE